MKVATASHLINPSLDLPPHKAQETALRMLTSLGPSIQGAIGKLSMSELSGNIVETFLCETDVTQFKVRFATTRCFRSLKVDRGENRGICNTNKKQVQGFENEVYWFYKTISQIPIFLHVMEHNEKRFENLTAHCFICGSSVYTRPLQLIFAFQNDATSRRTSSRDVDAISSSAVHTGARFWTHTPKYVKCANAVSCRCSINLTEPSTLKRSPTLVSYEHDLGKTPHLVLKPTCNSISQHATTKHQVVDLRHLHHPYLLQFFVVHHPIFRNHVFMRFQDTKHLV